MFTPFFLEKENWYTPQSSEEATAHGRSTHVHGFWSWKTIMNSLFTTTRKKSVMPLQFELRVISMCPNKLEFHESPWMVIVSLHCLFWGWLFSVHKSELRLIMPHVFECLSVHVCVHENQNIMVLHFDGSKPRDILCNTCRTGGARGCF